VVNPIAVATCRLHSYLQAVSPDPFFSGGWHLRAFVGQPKTNRSRFDRISDLRLLRCHGDHGSCFQRGSVPIGQ